MAATKDIAWSKNTYNLGSLLDKFKPHFPTIILVTRGYYGQDDIETLASDQVARIHTFDTQTRVLARDARGRRLSIPADYPIKFEVLEKKGKRVKARPLREILHTYALPVSVVFERKTRWYFRIGSQKYTTSNFGRIELQKIYQETFLKGNTIHEGVIDDKVMLVPTYVNIQVKVAEGLRHGTKEDWVALKAMYARAVSHIRFDKINGTRDINLYPTRPVDQDKLLAVGFGGGGGGKPRTGGKGVEEGYLPIVGGGPGKGGNNHRKPGMDMLDDGSGIVKINPNWTLVLNINKDDLSLQRSLSPASGAMVSSSVVGSLDNHLDGLDGYSDTSSLSGDSVTGSITTVQNVVRVSLCDDESVRFRSHRHRPDSRSSRTTTLSNVKRSRKTQTPGDPRADVYSGRRPRSAGPGDGIDGHGLRRSASLESLQDVRFTGNVTKASAYHHDDMDIVVPVKMDGMESFPRTRRYESIRRQSNNRGAVVRYGSRARHSPIETTGYGSLRPTHISRSAHDLRQTEVHTIPYNSLPRHRSLERVNYDEEDGLDYMDSGQMGGHRNIYHTDELWMGVSDHPMERDTYTLPYTRRPGLDRASRAANNVALTSTSTFPRTRTNDFRYVPVEKESSYLSSLPHGQLHMSISNLRKRRPLVITRTAAPRIQSTSSNDIFYQTSPTYRPPPPSYRALHSQPSNYMSTQSYSGLSSSSMGTSHYKLTDDFRSGRNDHVLENGVSSSETVSSTTGDMTYSGTMTLRRDHVGVGGVDAVRSSTYPVSPGDSEADLHSPTMHQRSGAPFEAVNGDFTTYDSGPQITSLTIQSVPIEMENGIDHSPPPLISVTNQEDVSVSHQGSLSVDAEQIGKAGIKENNLLTTDVVNGDHAIYATVNKLKMSERRSQDTKAVDSDGSSNPADPPPPPKAYNHVTETTNHGSTTTTTSHVITTTNHVTNHVGSKGSDSNHVSSLSSLSNASSSGVGLVNGTAHMDTPDGGKSNLERSGSVRSLREVYRQMGKTPPSSLRMKPSLSIAPASEVFSNALNTGSTQTGSSKAMVNGDDLAWQETSSYPMDSINDSLKELDAVLKQADPDTQSQSSHASSKVMEHFNFSMTGESTAL